LPFDERHLQHLGVFLKVVIDNGQRHAALQIREQTRPAEHWPGVTEISRRKPFFADGLGKTKRDRQDRWLFQVRQKSMASVAISGDDGQIRTADDHNRSVDHLQEMNVRGGIVDLGDVERVGRPESGG